MLSAAVFFCRALLPLSLTYITALAAVLALAFFAIGGGFSKRWGSAVFAAALISASLLSLFYGTKTVEKSEKALAFVGEESFCVTAEVTDVRLRSAHVSSYLVEITEVSGSSVRFGAVLEIAKGTSFEYGDILNFEAVFTTMEEELSYLRGKSVFVCAEAQDAMRIGKAENGFAYRIRKANEYISKRFEDFMGREGGGFCSAIILGNKSLVDTGVKLDFSRAGISHLLALSGLHLSVLTGALDFVLRGFTKKKLRGVILIISAFAFALFTGLSASVLRASVMLAFVYAADIFGEENDSITALFAAVWVILLVNGNAVYDVGFLLSASATLGIILVRPAFEGLFAKWKKPRKNFLLRALRATAKYFYGIFTMSAAAFIFTLPIAGHTFGEVSALGIISNFVFLPLATVLIISCALFVPLSYIPVASTLLAGGCRTLSGAIISLAATFSDFRGASVSLRYPFAPYLLALLMAAIIACIFIKKLSLLKLGVGALAFALSFAACFGFYANFTSGDMNLCFGAGKSGEYAAFSAGGENYVIDISTGGYSALRDALESRKYFCDTEIDNLVLTHYHNHHAGTIYRLSERVKIRRVLLPAPETESEKADFAYMAETLSQIGMEFIVYKRGEMFENGDVSIYFAPARRLSRSEKPLVAFTVEYGDFDFAYIEGAALESVFDYSSHLCADTVLVGANGPERKFRVYADAFAGAGRVIFAEGAEEYFRGIDHLGQVYRTEEYGGKITVLYYNK